MCTGSTSQWLFFTGVIEVEVFVISFSSYTTLNQIHTEAAKYPSPPTSISSSSTVPPHHVSSPSSPSSPSSRCRPPPVPHLAAAQFCQALDAVFLHGLRLRNRGYWPLATQITRKSAIKEILGLTNVQTDLARGTDTCYLSETNVLDLIELDQFNHT